MKGRSSKVARKGVPPSAVNDSEDTREHNNPGLANDLDSPPAYEELVQEVNIAQEDFNASATILGKSP
jgi:hypothetical protein